MSENPICKVCLSRIGGGDYRTDHLVSRYFSHSAQLSISSWTTEDAGALDPCGHCDNCTRSPNSVERKDVTLATWQILKIVDAVRKSGGKLTLVMLASLARGLQGGLYDVSQGGRNETKTKVKLDLETVAGGPVDMNKTVGFLISWLSAIG